MTTDAGQLTRDELATMTPAEITTARRAGRLDDLAAGRTHAATDTGDAGTGNEPPAQLSRADLAAMGPDAIVAAAEAGRLDDLLGRPYVARRPRPSDTPTTTTSRRRRLLDNHQENN